MTIKHLDMYSAYTLLNKNIVITYKIDGVPIKKSNYNVEKVNNKEYLFPYNFELNNFFKSVGTNILNISTFSCSSTIDYILDKKNMISKYDGNIIIKNFFCVNSSFIFSLLELLKNEYESPFPNDGFIIYNLDTKKIYKLKPFRKMSIDVKKIGDVYYSNNIELDRLNIISNNEENGIYRLYPLDKSGKKWEVGEKREDKDLSNPLWLIIKIQNLIKEDFNFKELEKLNIISYYNNYDLNNDVKHHLLKRKEKFLHRLNNLVTNKSKILDFGCGFGNYINNLDFDYYLGIDKDLFVLESISNKKKCSELWLDFSCNINYSEQLNKLGPLWGKTQKYNFKKLKKDYSLIIFNHSIHYVKNIKSLLNFIKSNYNNCFLFIGTLDIKESFVNKYQNMEILEETKNKFKVKFYNSWIGKELIEEYYKINYLKTLISKYQINFSIQPYNPSILK